MWECLWILNPHEESFCILLYLQAVNNQGLWRPCGRHMLIYTLAARTSLSRMPLPTILVCQKKCTSRGCRFVVKTRLLPVLTGPSKLATDRPVDARSMVISVILYCCRPYISTLPSFCLLIFKMGGIQADIVLFTFNFVGFVHRESNNPFLRKYIRYLSGLMDH